MIGDGIIQAVCIFKVSVFHAQFGSALIHSRHKACLAPRNPFGQSHSRIVGRTNDHTFQQILHGHAFAFLQKNLRASHRSRMGGGRDHVRIVQMTIINGFHNQKQRHNLRHRSRRQSLLHVFGIKNLPGRSLHQNSAFTGQSQIRVLGIRRGLGLRNGGVAFFGIHRQSGHARAEDKKDC